MVLVEVDDPDMRKLATDRCRRAVAGPVVHEDHRTLVPGQRPAQVGQPVPGHHDDGHLAWSEARLGLHSTDVPEGATFKLHAPFCQRVAEVAAKPFGVVGQRLLLVGAHVPVDTTKLPASVAQQPLVHHDLDLRLRGQGGRTARPPAPPGSAPRRRAGRRG
jgi:hypothetical protein